MANTNINTVITNCNGAISDHDESVIQLLGICQLNNGKLGALLDTDKGYYSINEWYVDDNGTPRISQFSITGDVDVARMDMTTREGIEMFNRTIILDSLKISKVVLIKVINM